MTTIHLSNGHTINAEASADELRELFSNDIGLLYEGLVSIGTEKKRVRLNPRQIVFIDED